MLNRLTRQPYTQIIIIIMFCVAAAQLQYISLLLEITIKFFTSIVWNCLTESD